MRALLAAVVLAGAPDGGSRPAVPPAPKPSWVIVQSWTQSVYEKPAPGGFNQIMLIPWSKADVIDAFVYPTVGPREYGRGFGWAVYVGGIIRFTGFAKTNSEARAVMSAQIEPLIEAHNRKYSKAPAAPAHPVILGVP